MQDLLPSIITMITLFLTRRVSLERLASTEVRLRLDGVLLVFRSVLGGTRDDTPMVVPNRGHRDGIRRLCRWTALAGVYLSSEECVLACAGSSLTCRCVA